MNGEQAQLPERSFLEDLRRGPFATAASVVLIVTIAVFRLPEEFVLNIRLGRPFSAAQSGLIFFLLAVVAVAQALYVGFKVLRPEEIDRARSAEPGDTSAGSLMRTVARNAAWIPLLTIVYGVSNLAFTGERANYWLFLFVCVAQLAWYFRQTGLVADHLERQTESTTESDGLDAI